ncbi:hypothetical protein K490DRAFT_52614 [Saccharata proteae CBS 121410]|uniref:Uncharacterized protein n=1 Tax=Saccharata proteae CBS 121410 TaxID=1314787 RepID=A0A9P4LYA2_9PEZI|nr:hypothetical protein K490DRAFT_52614 [Saccharata proteae CBS 121410]
MSNLETLPLVAWYTSNNRTPERDLGERRRRDGATSLGDLYWDRLQRLRQQIGLFVENAFEDSNGTASTTPSFHPDHVDGGIRYVDMDQERVFFSEKTPAGSLVVPSPWGERFVKASIGQHPTNVRERFNHTSQCLLGRIKRLPRQIGIFAQHVRRWRRLHNAINKSRSYRWWDTICGLERNKLVTVFLRLLEYYVRPPDSTDQERVFFSEKTPARSLMVPSPLAERFMKASIGQHPTNVRERLNHTSQCLRGRIKRLPRQAGIIIGGASNDPRRGIGSLAPTRTPDKIGAQDKREVVNRYEGQILLTISPTSAQRDANKTWPALLH